MPIRHCAPRKHRARTLGSLLWAHGLLPATWVADWKAARFPDRLVRLRNVFRVR